jgi:myo-inositol 2-dehydrogenase/D-chiro-inositol 1-dehydrogenase
MSKPLFVETQAHPLAVGVIGAGRRGVAHARAAQALGATLVAVADPDALRGRRLAEGAARTYADAAEMLARERLDVVYVTSPPYLHRDHTCAALAAGSHVLLEKPIALTMDEAREIGDAAERAGRWVHVCQQHRYTALADVARERLAGRRVALVHAWLYRQMPDIPGNWDRRWGGGHVVEWGIHYLDLCRYLLGEVEWVSATYTEQVLAGRPGWNNWDAYAVALQYACGAVGTLTSTYAAWPGIEGAGGLDIVADGLLLRFRGHRLSLQSPGREETVQETSDSTVAINAAFLTAIRTSDPAPLRIDYADALRTLALVLAANRSAELGTPVRPADL